VKRARSQEKNEVDSEASAFLARLRGCASVQQIFFVAAEQAWLLRRRQPTGKFHPCLGGKTVQRILLWSSQNSSTVAVPGAFSRLCEAVAGRPFRSYRLSLLLDGLHNALDRLEHIGITIGGVATMFDRGTSNGPLSRSAFVIVRFMSPSRIPRFRHRKIRVWATLPRIGFVSRATAR